MRFGPDVVMTKAVTRFLALLFVVLITFATVCAQNPPETRILPLTEVQAGMHGVAYTVFEGVTPEPMEVEILGILRNVNGPRGDIILARLHGKKVEYTGVVAGMSGSPVYVDGKLVGALAWRIGEFSKEPIAGITPIESMLEINALDKSRPADSVSARPRKAKPAKPAARAPGGWRISLLL